MTGTDETQLHLTDGLSGNGCVVPDGVLAIGKPGALEDLLVLW
jgi:hypothetical protein